MKIHHAVVFEGGGEEGLSHIYAHVKETLNIIPDGNPDFEVLEYERFTIEHARTLKERASHAPLSDRRVFVIVSQSLLREAQNALLKLLEEPAEGTHFYLLVPSVHMLLPTVRSRLSFGGTIVETDTYTELVNEYLNANTQERLTLLEPIISKKDREAARKFLQSLEQRLHKEGVSKNKTILSEIYFVRKYLSDRSSSVKMLLEHLVACS